MLQICEIQYTIGTETTKKKLIGEELNASVLLNTTYIGTETIKKLNGEIYDPICILNIKFDYEWIIKKEEHRKSVGTIWMDVHTYFGVDVETSGSTNKERKKSVH